MNFYTDNACGQHAGLQFCSYTETQDSTGFTFLPAATVNISAAGVAYFERSGTHESGGCPALPLPLGVYSVAIIPKYGTGGVTNVFQQGAEACFVINNMCTDDVCTGTTTKSVTLN